MYWQKNRNIDQWKRKRGRGESDTSVHNYNYMIFFTKLQNIYIGKYTACSRNGGGKPNTQKASYLSLTLKKTQLQMNHESQHKT